MGNREDLLAAAKQCLLEKGYDRTTVRDIASAANVSMAAIGYHYGSREALLNEALSETMDDWAGRVGRALAYDPLVADTPAAQFESKLTRLIDSFADNRQFWLTSLEAFLQSQRSPELKAQLAETHRDLTTIATTQHDDGTPKTTANTIGAVQLALISGLMIQYLTDEETPPTATDVLTGLRTLLGTDPT